MAGLVEPQHRARELLTPSYNTIIGILLVIHELILGLITP
jgi:hypothetical protein